MSAQDAGLFVAGAVAGIFIGGAVVAHALRQPASGGSKRSPTKGAGWYVVAFKDEKRPGQAQSRRRIGYVDGPYEDRSAALDAILRVPGYWYDPVARRLSTAQAERMFAT